MLICPYHMLICPYHTKGPACFVARFPPASRAGCSSLLLRGVSQAKRPASGNILVRRQTELANGLECSAVAVSLCPSLVLMEGSRAVLECNGVGPQLFGSNDTRSYQSGDSMICCRICYHITPVTRRNPHGNRLSDGGVGR